MQKHIRLMTKELILDGLRKAKFNFENANIGQCRKRRSFQDYQRALQIAIGFFSTVKFRLNAGTISIPKERKDIERFVDAYIAEQSFNDAIVFLGKSSPLKTRNDKKLMQEINDALTVLRNSGKEYENKVDAFEWMLKKQSKVI